MYKYLFDIVSTTHYSINLHSLSNPRAHTHPSSADSPSVAAMSPQPLQNSPRLFYYPWLVFRKPQLSGRNIRWRVEKTATMWSTHSDAAPIVWRMSDKRIAWNHIATSDPCMRASPSPQRMHRFYTVIPHRSHTFRGTPVRVHRVRRAASHSCAHRRRCYTVGWASVRQFVVSNSSRMRRPLPDALVRVLRVCSAGVPATRCVFQFVCVRFGWAGVRCVRVRTEDPTAVASMRRLCWLCCSSNSCAFVRCCCCYVHHGRILLLCYC